jgi:hypothetical protein
LWRGWPVADGNQLIAETTCLTGESALEPLLALRIGGLPESFIELYLSADQRIKHGCNLPCGGSHSASRAQLSLEAAEIAADETLASMERLSGHAENLTGGVIRLAHAAPKDPSSADVIVGTKRQPGEKVSGRRPAR